MGIGQILLCLSTLTLSQFLTSTLSASFTVTNNCSDTVWPGIISSAGSAATATTGFTLSEGESQSVSMPPSWSGRVWGRTLCSVNSSDNFSCQSGDCGTSEVACSGSGSTTPATLAEFSLNGTGGMDFYDISVLDGYNLPMLIAPVGGSSVNNCRATGCSMDLNVNCPSELEVIKSSQIVACKTPCVEYGSPEYCCTGEYANSNSCKPTPYSNFFVKACPTAFIFPFDDSTSTFTCAGLNYVITFCPDATSLKSIQDSKSPPPAPGPPMVFLGGDDDKKTHQDSFALPSSTASVILVLVASWLLTDHLLL